MPVYFIIFLPYITLRMYWKFRIIYLYIIIHCI